MTISLPSFNVPSNGSISSLIVGSSPFIDDVFGREGIARISQLSNLLLPPITPNELLFREKELREVDVLVTTWMPVQLDEHLLQAAPKLKAVFHAAGSIRSLATPAAWARSISISSAFQLNARPVAEYTLGCILLSLKRFWALSRAASKVWENREFGVVPGAYRSKVGLISLGAVGRLMAELLRPFDITVLAYDPFVSATEARSLGVELAELDELFRCCDVVSLHAPLLNETKLMIRGKHFAAMKAAATFINTARGGIVNEVEMQEELIKRPSLQAILDVTTTEPPVVNSPLWSLPNVVITPHIAGAVQTECSRLGDAMIDELSQYVNGEPLRWQVTQKEAERMA